MPAQEIHRNTGSPSWRGGVPLSRTPARDRPCRVRVADGFVGLLKPGNAGGGKGPEFKVHGPSGGEPGDWREPTNSTKG